MADGPTSRFDPTTHYRVVLRNNVSGEVRTVRYAWPWDPTQVYQWTDGNHGCDCNRLGMFDDARPPGTTGWKFPEDAEDFCSEGHISALHAVLPDGSKVQLDEPATRKECLDRFFEQVHACGFEAMLHEDDHIVVRKR